MDKRDKLVLLLGLIGFIAMLWLIGRMGEYSFIYCR